MAGAIDQLRANGTSHDGAAKMNSRTNVIDDRESPDSNFDPIADESSRLPQDGECEFRYHHPRRLTEDIRSDRSGFNKTNPQLTHSYKRPSISSSR